MNAHNPFDANQDWTNPYCQNSSNDPMVDALLGNAYHVVRTVYCNLGNLKLIYDLLNQYGMVIGVQSEAELKALTTKAEFARIYGFDNTNKRQVTDYLYVEGDRTGILPDDQTATGSWVEVATSNSGGVRGKVAPPYIPYVYNNGAALGGETTIPVPSGTVGVPFIIVEGSTKTVGYGFTYDATTLTVTLAQPLEVGDEVVLLLTGTPAVPDNPNVSDWIQINWLYNGGYASGGEQVIAIPYTFESVPAIYKNGERYHAGLANKSYTVDAANQRILLTEPLAANDRLIVTIGGESTTLIMSDRTIQEVARSANVHENEVILSTNTTQYLNGKKVIYDVVAQKIYNLPTLPTNVYINSVSNGKLTYSPGNVTVTLAPNQQQNTRELWRRSLAEAGYNLVDGSFESGGTLVNANDVLLQERTGKAFTGAAGAVAAGTNPASGGFVDVSGYKTDRLTSVASLGIIGDGVTDWSAAIQYAIDTYGSLYFPEGTYICANIQLRSGVQLVAASWSTVLKLPDGAITRSINGSLPDSHGRYPANVISTVLNHNGGAYFDNGARAKMLNNSFYIVDGAEVSGFTIDGNKAGNPVGDVGENASAMGAGVCIFLSRGVKVKNNRIINCRQDGVILGYTLCGGSDECDVSDNVFFGNQRTNIALITGQRNKITGNLGGPTTGGIDTIKGAAVDLEPNWADEVCANNILTDNIMLGQVSLVCANPAYMRNNKFHGNLWIGTALVNPSSDTQGSVFDADTFIADTTQPTPGPWISKAGPFNPSSASIKTTPPVRFSNCTAIGFDTLLQNLTQGQHENLVVENSTIRVKTIGQVVRGYRVDIKNNDITMDGDATSDQSILWSNSLGAIVPHQGCNSFKGNSVRGVSQSRLLEVINDKSYTNSRKTVEIHNNDFDVTGHTAIGAVTGDFDFTKNTITDWKPIDVSNVVKPFSIKGNTLSANASTDMFVNQAGYINDISVSGNELTNININLQRPSGVTVNSNEMVDCSISVLYSLTASGVGGNSFSFNRMKNRSKNLVPITATLEGSSTTEDFWFKDIYKGNVISGYASGISIAAELTSVSEVS